MLTDECTNCTGAQAAYLHKYGWFQMVYDSLMMNTIKANWQTEPTISQPATMLNVKCHRGGTAQESFRWLTVLVWNNRATFNPNGTSKTKQRALSKGPEPQWKRPQSWSVPDEHPYIVATSRWPLDEHNWWAEKHGENDSWNMKASWKNEHCSGWMLTSCTYPLSSIHGSLPIA